MSETSIAISASDGPEPEYVELLNRISATYTTGQSRAVQAVNVQIAETYLQIGRNIVEFEQEGRARAEYGAKLLIRLSRDLTLQHGKGFSRSNLSRFRQFYLIYPKRAKASHILSWSHYVELLKIDDEPNLKRVERCQCEDETRSR